MERPALTWLAFWRMIRSSPSDGALLGHCSDCRGGQITVRVLMVRAELEVKCPCGRTEWRFRLVPG